MHPHTHLSGDKFVPKQLLDEVDQMIVKVTLDFFVEAFEMGQSQDEDFFWVLFGPDIYVPEQRLITGRAKQVLTLWR